MEYAASNFRNSRCVPVEEEKRRSIPSLYSVLLLLREVSACAIGMSLSGTSAIFKLSSRLNRYASFSGFLCNRVNVAIWNWLVRSIPHDCSSMHTVLTVS